MAVPGFLAPINDVTTDLDQPPVFFVTPPHTHSYDHARLGSLHRKFYGDLANVAIPWPPEESLSRIERLVKRRGWTVSGVDRPGLRIQAVAITRLMRFRDDVVIAVRPATPTSSIVAMRSKSRVGRGDLGTNARRIRVFLEALASGG